MPVAVSWRSLGAFALVGTLLLGGCAGTPSAVGTHGPKMASSHHAWVPAWALSPLPAGNNPSFDNQTVRQLLPLVASGEAVRVRLSNELGTRPVVIGAARLALADADGSIRPGSDRPLLFGGQAGATLPPGAPLLSDPLPVKVAAGDRLVISIHYPGPAFVAGHQPLVTLAGPGDLTAAPVLQGETKRAPTLVGAVEVLAAQPAPVLVAIGDSITEGDNSHTKPTGTYPAKLAALLAARKDEAARVVVLNHGISGNRLLHDQTGANLLARFDRDALGQPGVSRVVLLIGINDIGHSIRRPEEVVTARELIQGLSQLRDRAHTQGVQLFIGTIMPYAGAGYYSPEGDAVRREVNDWIRRNEGFDGVVDFDAATRDPASPSQLQPAYDVGDKLHPSDAGYAAMATEVEKTLFGGK
ncbi:SGNH/GDSL hydrolase family protein [Niveispirillum sp. SYP-B3756]|uniref:SGNH/GDSL hydrolase family protein n=1 Tax=Niveispirillum sp. SYP-B3756 TaxID=2662178 RepID=UPI001291DC56|nr:SGNH/GDSL hydrolase family protein [Niveispirillum sp. SYP-B3756]MQP64901.1 SGNH/GDSL hydrolase family protein [Niveispirillum sp. SYP-B3756]